MPIENGKERKRYSFEQKISIIKKYFEAGNSEIKYNTIYEENPIGLWVVNLRNQAKKNRRFSKEQMKILRSLGVFQGKVYTSVDEKIDALIEWKEKYPNIIIDRKDKDAPISEKDIQKLKKAAEKYGVKYSELIKRYRTLRTYNNYVRGRKSRGKLTEEQIKKCQEGNLGGIFGFSTKRMELSSQLNTNVKEVDDIISRYGSIDAFIQMYRTGKMSLNEILHCNKKLINNMYDIDNSIFLENYKKLLFKIFGLPLFEKNDFVIFSSINFNIAINTLTSREEEIVKEKFGLLDGKIKKNRVVAKKYAVTPERVRQILASALSKLSDPTRTYYFKPIIIRELKENEFITEEEREALTELENYIWNNACIFKQNLNDNIKEKFDIIRKVQRSINKRKKVQNEDLQKRADVGNLSVFDLGLKQNTAKWLHERRNT